jgi:uncharacterized protein YndB with AHSA1/START domain
MNATSTETVLVSEVIPASRHAIYSAWLDTRQHSAFTGDTAVIEPAIGGRHSTFGGYASGTMLELEPHRRIVLSWRSTEFPEGSPDSRLEVTLEDTAGGTLVTLLHTQIPEGQGDRYKESWIQYYLEPLKRYFSKRVSNGVNGHRHRLAYAEKEDHVGDNERENDDDLQMQAETDDQDDLEDSDKERGDAEMDDDTVLAAGEQDDMDEDRDDLTSAQGEDEDEDAQDEEADEDTVEVGADAIQEVSTEDAHRVVARPMEDDVRSPVVVEDMTGGYDEKPARARPKAKPARAKAAARKPPAKKVVKPAAQKATKKATKPAAKPAAKAKKATKPAAKPAKKALRIVARAGKAAKGKKAPPKTAAAKRPKATAKAKNRR